MKNVVILGAGTAGTIVANQLTKKLPADWAVRVIDPERDHVYQPDLIFVPFGDRDPAKMIRARKRTLFPGVDWILGTVEKIDPDARQVILEDGGRVDYDFLVIASGSHVHPEETEGLLGDHWGRTAHEFYTVPGAVRLREALAGFEGGRMVVNVVEMPIKCPVAPLEFLFLSDAYFTRRGLRDRVEIVFATPLDGAFTRPVASQLLSSMLEERGIHVEPEFNTGEVDPGAKVVRSWDERELPYDLLVTIPTHMGASFIGASGLGNELDFVPTERHNLLAKGHDNIFVLGDATDLPSSKAGSVAHFQSEVLVENLLRAIGGRSLVEGFDGHSQCFIETGFGKGMLIDFNYDVEPLPGHFPLPWVGPMTLLRESRRNHWGKLAFRWIYWNALLPGRPLPVTTHMSMVGKRQPEDAALLASA
jgi:sulfide:quinone oxidoreductase